MRCREKYNGGNITSVYGKRYKYGDMCMGGEQKGVDREDRSG